MGFLLYLACAWWGYGVIYDRTITIYSSWLGYVTKKCIMCILFGWAIIPIAIVKSALFR